MNIEQMIDHASAWTFTEDTLLIGGLESSGRRLRCVQEPRITLISRYNHRLNTVHQTWRVDGVDQISFAVALARVMTINGKEGGQ